MRLTRTYALASVVALLIVSSVPMAPADHDDNLTTEWLTYIGTGVLGNVNGNGHAAAVLPCDDTGVNGVRFCDALASDNITERPHRVFVDVRDTAGLRAGAILQWAPGTPGQPSSQVFCGSINTFVPENAETLTVRPRHATQGSVSTGQVIGILGNETLDSLPSVGVSPPCGSVGTTGLVTVVWRYNAPVPCFHSIAPCP